MPITVAHAAAVIPLFRFRKLRPAALMIGSMMPDLPMFLPALPHYDYYMTHSLRLGLPIAALTGLVPVLLYEWLKQPLVWLLPADVQAKLAPHTQSHWPSGRADWLSCCCALAIGAATHIVWDSFTHHSRFGVHVFPVLSSVWISNTPIGRVRGYKLLQHVTGLLGMGVLALYARRRLAQMPSTQPTAPLPVPRVGRVLFTGMLLLLIPAVCTLLAYHKTSGTGSLFWSSFARLAATTALGAQGAALLGAVITIKLLHARRSPRA